MLAFAVVRSAPGTSVVEAVSSGTLELVLEGAGLGPAHCLEVPLKKATK